VYKKAHKKRTFVTYFSKNSELKNRLKMMPIGRLVGMIFLHFCHIWYHFNAFAVVQSDQR